MERPVSGHRQFYPSLTFIPPTPNRVPFSRVDLWRLIDARKPAEHSMIVLTWIGNADGLAPLAASMACRIACQNRGTGACCASDRAVRQRWFNIFIHRICRPD